MTSNPSVLQIYIYRFFKPDLSVIFFPSSVQNDPEISRMKVTQLLILLDSESPKMIFYDFYSSSETALFSRKILRSFYYCDCYKYLVEWNVSLWSNPRPETHILIQTRNVFRIERVVLSVTLFFCPL